VNKNLIILVLLISTACDAPSTEPSTPSPVATVAEPLPEDTPSATATNVSPTPIPAAKLAPTLPPGDLSKGSPEVTGEPVIIFHQEGGFAGVDLTWSIYDNGLIVTPAGEELSVAPAIVEELLEIITQTGFFEIVQPKTSNICCDFFTYTLTVSTGNLNNTITFTDGDPNAPPGLTKAVSAVQQLITQ
jgi:hypothetical protein